MPRLGDKHEERSEEMMTPNLHQEIARQRQGELHRVAARERFAAQVDVDRTSVIASVVAKLRKLGPGRRPAPKPHVAASS
jgi:hypothetical protein